MFKLGRVTLMVGIALTGWSCIGQEELGPDVGQQSRAVSGPWLYYPLDVNNGFWAGYHGYGFNGLACNIHNAYDLAGSIGNNVRAAGHGTVVHVVKTCTSCTIGSCSAGGGCGNSVTIAHDGPGAGEWTKYCHMNDVSVNVNDVVDIGTVIGHLGQTEAGCAADGGVPHTHFTVSTTAGGGWGCLVGNGNNNCIDPGSPPGVPSKDSGCAGTITPNVQWVTSGGTVVFAKDAPPSCAPESVATTCRRMSNLLGGRACGGGWTNNCGGPVDCGGCPSGQYCNGGMCEANPTPTCPTGSNWHLAGRYCWNATGFAYGATNHLYNCSAPGAAASDLGACSEGCRGMGAQVNDQCWEATSTCYPWRAYNTYACGNDAVNGNPMVLYHCYYGTKSGIQWCSSSCQTRPGLDDICH